MGYVDIKIFTVIIKKKVFIFYRRDILFFFMTRVKDITHDLGKLRDRKVLPSDGRPIPVASAGWERKLAFNAAGFFFWTLIVLMVGLQFAFLAWLA